MNDIWSQRERARDGPRRKDEITTYERALRNRSTRARSNRTDLYTSDLVMYPGSVVEYNPAHLGS